MQPFSYPQMARMLQLAMAQDPKQRDLNPYEMTEGGMSYYGGPSPARGTYFDEGAAIGKAVRAERAGVKDMMIERARKAVESQPQDKLWEFVGKLSKKQSREVLWPKIQRLREQGAPDDEIMYHLQMLSQKGRL